MLTFLYDLIISPIETIVEWSFLFVTDKMPFIGVLGAVVGVSLIINFLALPLYIVADSIKDGERLIQLKMQKQIDRIKQTFKGDERFMMMQALYTENHYHPVYSFKSSLSILIEIPFFIAAYRYLSHNEILQSANLNLGFMSLNLGAPDHLFQIGGIFINILPITMTLINVISALVYSRGAPKKELVQLYALSLVFLVLLYESPSGLVIYWICNNLFSLAKNIFQKSGYGSKIVYGIFAFMLFCVCFAISLQKRVAAVNVLVVWTAMILFLLVPYLCTFVFKAQWHRLTQKISEKAEKSYWSVFFVSAVGLALFLGFVLPSSVIATSPLEFSCLGQTNSPFSYVVSSFAFFLGFCVFWPSAIYKMFGKKVRFFLSLLLFVLFVSALANVYFFSYEYGNISQTFAFENDGIFRNKGIFYTLMPLLVMVLCAFVFFLFEKKKIREIAVSILVIVCVAEGALGIFKSHTIIATYTKNKENLLAAKSSGKPIRIESVFHLAKQDSGKKNVVVIFLDRGINSFIPKILQEFPELQTSFDGFTWFKNSLSFGDYTTTGAPAMLGGYEYSPEKINERKDELLREKHNEASLVMPRLFLDAGWSVTITDPPLPNYSDKTDLSAFKKYPQMNVSELAGKYSANYIEAMNIKGREVDAICKKQSRNFCIIQALYPKARMYFYNVVKDPVNETTFENHYASLYFFNELTDFDSTTNNFFFIGNDGTHPDADAPDWGEQCFISEEEIKQFYDFKNSKDLVHYRVNALCIKAIGKWLDFLKENDSYDNTRIIIVSDHGRGIHLEEFKDFADYEAPAFFSALLMFKDFGIRGGVSTSDVFMMNADAPFLAKEGLDLSEINPFTGQKFEQEKDGEVRPYYSVQHNQTRIYNNKQFDLATKGGWAVKESIFDEKNWRRLE